MPAKQKNTKSTKIKTSNVGSKSQNTASKVKKKFSQIKQGLSKVKNFANQAADTVERVQQGISKVQDTANKLNNFISNPGSFLEAFQGESSDFINRYQDFVKTEIKGDRRLVKAVLFPKESGGKIIRFMFNPTQLNFSRSVVIKDMEGAVTSAGIPKVNFAHVNPWQLKLSQILFDTYEDEKNTSVLEVIQPLLNAVDYKKFDNTKVGMSKAKRPPVYYFTWGENNYLKCMVTDITYNLTMFLPNGMPVRATVDISLKEVDDSPTTPLPSSQGGAQQNKSLVDSPNTEPVSDSSSRGDQGSQTPGSTGKDKKGKDQKGQPQKGQKRQTQKGQPQKGQKRQTQKRSTPKRSTRARK